jgi:hypothetical protein
MTWHYRLLKDDDIFAVHEVYTLDDGKVMWSGPITFEGPSPQDVITQLTNALEDITARSPLVIDRSKLVLEPDAEPAEEQGG